MPKNENLKSGILDFLELLEDLTARLYPVQECSVAGKIWWHPLGERNALEVMPVSIWSNLWGTF